MTEIVCFSQRARAQANHEGAKPAVKKLRAVHDSLAALWRRVAASANVRVEFLVGLRIIETGCRAGPEALLGSYPWCSSVVRAGTRCSELGVQMTSTLQRFASQGFLANKNDARLWEVCKDLFEAKSHNLSSKQLMLPRQWLDTLNTTAPYTSSKKSAASECN